MKRVVWMLALAAGATAQQAWKAADDLPNVDFSKLNAAQKTKALAILRENPCSCGCGMKIAQCRVDDPKCTYSRGLAAMTVKSVGEGKSPDEIRKAIASASGERKVLEDPVSIRTEGSPVKGAANARITLVEFSDFQCPYCSVAVKDIDAALKAFPADVRLVYKQFPLSEIHGSALMASRAALAAHAQGKFWPMHDRLFAHGRELTRVNMNKWAAEIGLDMKRFAADMDSGTVKQQIDRDLADGEQAGVEGTPAVFVNGKHYNGVLDPKAFGEILRAELKQAK